MAVLDSILILAVLLYINAGETYFAGVGTLVAAAASTVASWMWWRTSEGPLAAVALAVSALAVFYTADNPLSIFVLWCAIVALLLSVGARGAYLYAGVIVSSCLGLQLSAGQGAVRVVSETVAGALAAVAGLTLAGAVRQQRLEEQALMDTNRRLHAALADSRELALTQERARIAATLHDGLGHRLTTIGMSIDYATRMAGTRPDKAISELGRARSDVSAALEEMRATVRAMKPVTPVAGDILATLRQLADSFRSTALNVEFESSGPRAGSFSEEQAVLMLRFTQEALTNVVRHSCADRVLIRASGDGVVVADDGTGNEAAEDFGLTSLRERAASLGATISAEPHGGPDGGFRIALHLGEAR